jgi:hypothetical protein
LQLLSLNVVDRDWRDLLFDTRINNEARAFHHELFKAAWLVSPWLPQADAVEQMASQGVPVLQLNCRDVHSAVCVKVISEVQKAMGIEPVNCALRSGLVRLSDYMTAS